MRITVFFLLVSMIATPYCYCAAVGNSSSTSKKEVNGAILTQDTKRLADSTTTLEINAENVKITYCYEGDCREQVGPVGPTGPTGPTGPQGPKGPPGPSGGGALYTRWGRIDCPSTNGTDRVYEGIAAGGWYASHGGGTNYLCITKTPEYLSTSSISVYSPLYGTEYETTIINSVGSGQNVPCAVCHTSERTSKLMIPGTLSCPISWTEEYDGYLMTSSSSHGHNHATTFECVDRNASSISGLSGSTDGALFFHVSARCGYGLPCSESLFANNRAITCVVCTK